MLVPIFILLTGLLLIFVEFFLPGGIMGATGGVLVVVSVSIFAMESESLLSIIAFMAAAVAGVVIVIRFALWRIQKAEPGQSVYLESDQGGYVASDFEEAAVGKDGEALSDLKPSGHITVDGARYQAVSQSGYVKKGVPIHVIGGRGAYLIVKPKKKEAAK